MLGELFGREVCVMLTATGTGANALALACLVQPWGAVLAHEEAHVVGDECGAPEFFTHGAKMVGLPGYGAKLTPETVAARLALMPRDATHVTPPQCLSITQATECGMVYAPGRGEGAGRPRPWGGLKVHMDGARFANAVARLGCHPADVTWRAGVDVLTFGFTKNGAWAAEAVVSFDPALAASSRGGASAPGTRSPRAASSARRSRRCWPTGTGWSWPATPTRRPTRSPRR